jgi:hypothetical protein
VRRIALTVLMLVVLLPSAAFASISYLCSMDGKVRSACCCPSKAKKRDAAPVTTIKSACCCEVTTAAPVKTTAIDSPKADTPVQPNFVAVSTEVPLSLSQHPAAAFIPRSQPPPNSRGRSLFASHCALLL